MESGGVIRTGACSVACGTFCDVERGRVWAVTRRDTW